MMSWCKANAWRTLLVWMTIATLVQPQWLLAVEATGIEWRFLVMSY